MSDHHDPVTVRLEVTFPPEGGTVDMKLDASSHAPDGHRMKLTEAPLAPTFVTPRPGATVRVRSMVGAATGQMCIVIDAESDDPPTDMRARVMPGYVSIPPQAPSSNDIGPDQIDGIRYSFFNVPGAVCNPTVQGLANTAVVWIGYGNPPKYRVAICHCYAQCCNVNECDPGAGSGPCASGSGTGSGTGSGLHGMSALPPAAAGPGAREWKVDLQGFGGLDAKFKGSAHLRECPKEPGVTWTNGGDATQSPSVELRRGPHGDWKLTIRAGEMRAVYTLGAAAWNARGANKMTASAQETTPGMKYPATVTLTPV